MGGFSNIYIYIYTLFKKFKNKIKQNSSLPLDSSRSGVLRVCVFFPKSHALFTGPVSTESGKINFKTRFHGTIHTFKNYFVTTFSIISF